LSTELNATADAPAGLAPARWGAFGHAGFTVIWTASMFANLGIAMFDTAAGWS
jgi:hypothetical protein